MSRKPNVIIVLSDDQGYGDIACHGNPWLNTPCLDKFASECVSLTDFHTSPMCAPTRAGLMSGMYPDRVGVWSTLNGCFIMDKDTVAMPKIFKDHGYKTGMFGKWHLGDSYPFRACDKGFDSVLSFGGGVIGEVPDYWDNDYFNDKYLVNGEWQDFNGYCTDIWFDNALNFVEESVKEDEPFYMYIANNAPHRPFNVDSKYSAKYEEQGLDKQLARFYGMIENIDENFGKLDKKLHDLGIADQTIVVYFGDNGTCGGAYMDEHGFTKTGFNASLRGKKCDPYEGGHRNMCFIRWPEGNITGGYNVQGLSANIDLYPTLMSMAGIDNESLKFDGKDISSYLAKENSTIDDRQLVIHNMQFETPVKYKDYCVLTNEWRLTQTNRYSHSGIELYNIGEDIEQKTNVSSNHSEIVEQLSEVYNRWWQEISPVYNNFNRIIIGSEYEEVTKLTSHAWHGSTEMSYNQEHVRNGINDEGYWTLEVDRDGEYIIELRRWPKETNKEICASVDPIINREFVHDRNSGKVYNVRQASIKIQDVDMSKAVSGDDTNIRFKVCLTKGKAMLQTKFITDDCEIISAYYAYIHKIN